MLLTSLLKKNFVNEWQVRQDSASPDTDPHTDSQTDPLHSPPTPTQSDGGDISHFFYR